VPVFPNRDPTTAIKPAQDSKTVNMTANALHPLGPEPSASLVVMVFLPHVPVCAHPSPVPLPVAPESALTVQVNADSLVSTP